MKAPHFILGKFEQIPTTELRECLWVCFILSIRHGRDTLGGPATCSEISDKRRKREKIQGETKY